MNEFAINGAAINGQPNEWVTLEGSTAIDFACAFDGIRGAGGVGTVSMQLDTSGSISSGLIGSGEIATALQAQLAPSLLTMITGEIPVTWSGNLAGSVRRRASGNVAIDVDVELNIIRWAMGRGTISVAFGLTGAGRIVQRVQIDGACGIVLDPLFLDGRRTPAIRPAMPLEVAVDLSGPAWLEMRGEGASDIEVVLDGIGRLGGKVDIEGSSRVEFSFRGEARAYTLVPIEGIADIQFLLVTEKAGRPPIPTTYVPAPASRQFDVSRQSRERDVSYDRSL